MIGELSILSEWIPEQMEPGTIFVLENAGDVGDKEDPYWAVLSCPKCGQLGLITRKQVAGLVPVICGSDKCPAQFFIRDEQIVLQKGQLDRLCWMMSRARQIHAETSHRSIGHIYHERHDCGRAFLFGSRTIPGPGSAPGQRSAQAAARAPETSPAGGDPALATRARLDGASQ